MAIYNPDGTPHYIRIYDAPDFIDRYTVVFTGRFSYPRGWYPYRAMMACLRAHRKRNKTMRKVTKNVVGAFVRNMAQANGNTWTDGTALFLHGNKIAEWVTENIVRVTMAGWPTSTTRDRLNGIPGVSAYQSKGEQYINGQRVDSRDWVEVNIPTELMKREIGG